MSNEPQLKELIIRYQQGKCSEEEMQRLRTMLADSKNTELLKELYDTLPEGFPDDKLFQRKAGIYQQILNDKRVRRKVADESVSIRKLWWKKPWIAVAAAALIVMVPFLYNNLSFFHAPEDTPSSNLAQNVIVPGGDRARIILDNGSEINLEETLGDTVIVQNGFSIVKDENGTIYYRYDDATALAQTAVHNTVVTPKGGQYQVVLPDGTRVWLNAESKLRYPVYFGQDKRVVELEGEGYFEVAKQTSGAKRIPFIVETGVQELEVLGTTFNIEAYGKNIKTTLVEGKVRLGLEAGGQEVLLQPNDQATISNRTQRFDVKKVDPIYATAWKNGNFAFRKATIKEVMESVARWYNVEVVYNAAVDNSLFTGTISRFEQIDNLLELIELTGSVHFKIEGRRVIVEE